MKRTLSSLVMAGAMLCTMSIPAFAAQEQLQAVPISAPILTPVPIESPISETPASVLPNSILYYGQVAQIDKDESGTITRLVMESEAYGAYVMSISPKTVWIDSAKRAASDPADLTVGERLYISRSPIATFSTPPQSPAFAVVRNVPQDASIGKYHVVSKAITKDDGSMAITVDNGGLIISLDANTALSAYQGEKAPALADLTKGSRIMAWYNIVLTSYPGQTYAEQLMLLPAAAKEGATLTLTIDGKASSSTGTYKDGVAMVPVAATAKALGYDVAYTVGKQGPVITVESKAFAIHLEIDQQVIFGLSKDTDNATPTDPQDFGAPAYIQNPGTTWAPAQIFELLDHTVTLDGTTLTIQ